MSLILAARRGRGSAAWRGNGFAYLAPRFTLPAGLTFNASTGAIDGTTVDTTWIAPTGTTWTCPDTASFVTALASAVDGDVIVLTAGATYTGPFRIRNRGTNGWVYIVTSALTSLNAVAPAGPNLWTPVARQRVIPSDASLMPKLIPGGALTNGVLDFSQAALGYRFVGINFTGVAGVGQFALIDITPHDGSHNQIPVTDPSQTAQKIIFDRCLLAPALDTDNIRGGIQFIGRSIATVDCDIRGFWDDGHQGTNGTDSQAVLMYGPGPFKIVNCYLEAGSENVAAGGSTYPSSALLPYDIEMRGNYITRRVAWQTDGTKNVKNLFELKSGIRVLLEGNVLDGNWSNGQQGWSIVLWSVNQLDNSPWAETRDVTVMRNRTKNGGGLELTDIGGHTAISMSRVQFFHTTFERCGSVAGNGTTTGPSNPTNSVLNQIGINPASTGFGALAIENCSGFFDNVPSGAWFQFGSPSASSPGPFFLRNNVVPVTTYGIFSSAHPGNAALALADNFSTFSCDHNVTAFPATVNDVAVADTASLRFADIANGDLHLLAGSPALGAGSDGRNAGADIDMVNTYCANAPAGGR